MALFQTQVERQFLAGITTDLTPFYKKHLDYFGNPAIQANILEVIEEQYQGEFIRALFVDILGYTAQPHPNFNLVREKKNETDAKSADAAISINNQIVGVIELKDHKTQDLKKVEAQAFGYKNNHKNCHYVVTSNFERLRFYIDNAVDFIEFDLFNLSFDEFRRLWLCLSYESIAKNLPQEIKNQSISSEDKVTKDLYKDYSVFKRLLFDSIVALNPDYVKLLLFKKTQKLLDRFLFLLFAEDKELLPANSVKGTVDKWKKFNADPMNDYQSLYSRFVKYFKLLDEGYKDANIEIYAYNGGLFANDELLNQIKVDDAILSENVLKLAAYDYGTDVDVNILGHIFENSLNEIEQVANEITTGEKTTSKRKQDGVFYTPRYITQYIVENTVGRLCEEKKAELGIGEELFEYKRADKRKQALKIFDAYREWLLHISIVDPACGSGAFLNMALDFLMAEHNWIDRQQEKIAGLKGHYSMELSNIENTILENNLFGVDINEESVEIAKLSLWLRTAKPHRKLNSLNNNIKCGNSLIDDPAVASDKAFDWHKEFPHIFAKGGFDVVIGNPPYVRQELLREFTISLEKYNVHQGKADLYTYFYEKATDILKAKGLLGFISSGKFFEASYGKSLVMFLVHNLKFLKIINFDDLEVFEGISAYPLIFIGKKEIFNKDYIFDYSFAPENDFSTISEFVSNIPFSKIQSVDFVENDYSFYTQEIAHIFKKVNSNCIYLKDINCLPLVGIKTGYNEGFIVNEMNSKFVKPYVFGREIKRYTSLMNDINIVFPYLNYDGEYQLVDESELGNIIDFLEGNRGRLESRAIIKDGVKNGTKVWYEFQQINKKIDFETEYIIYPNVSLGANFTLSKGKIIDMTGFIIPTNDKFLLTILNSKLCTFLMRKLAITRRGGYQEYKVQYLEKIPLKVVTKDIKSSFILKANEMLLFTKDLQFASQKFQRMLQRKFDLEVLPGKLQNWYLLTYKEFITELGKKKVKLTLAQEAEWEEYFNAEKAKALEIKKQIDDTDREIDCMVYALYELTEEEVGIVEGKG